MPDISLDEIERFSNEALAAGGLSKSDREIVTQSILFAHSSGKGTHGIGRLPIYLRKMSEGLMSAETPLDELSCGPAFALLDAKNGFGQVAGIKGMRRACELARVCGIGLVGIRASNNFGTAAFLAKEATKHAMMGMIMSNAAPAIAPTGGHTPLFGTNPIAFGFPGADTVPPIILDMATSTAARGKVRQAALNGHPIPLGWALDAEGNPTTDAQAGLDGSMIPIGGAKGYGLSLAVDILAGMLTGSGFAGQARPLNDPDQPSNCGHFLVAIDLSKFLPPELYQQQIKHLVEKTKASGAPGEVFLPGERSGTILTETDAHTPLSEAVLAKLATVAEDLNIAPITQ